MSRILSNRSITINMILNTNALLLTLLSVAISSSSALMLEFCPNFGLIASSPKLHLFGHHKHHPHFRHIRRLHALRHLRLINLNLNPIHLENLSAAPSHPEIPSLTTNSTLSSPFENGQHDVENVFHLLKDLPHDCFTYEADKYIYEYCHMESARQTGLHAENNSREEYDLGHFIPNRSIQKYSPLLKLAKISLVEGGVCEGGATRRTKVKFFCTDPKLSMHIISAREKSLCNYRILVHVPELCFK